METNEKKLKIGLAAIVGIAVIIGILIFTGVLNLSDMKKFFGREIEIEPDAHLMTSRNAYDIALLKAREWKPDAVLARVFSLIDATGPSGRSDNWDLLFVSKSLKGRGYRIIIRNREIFLIEEIPFVGFGGELPENIISSKEAVNMVHQIKGYENEEIILVEMVYDPNGKWFWGVKTKKGTVAIDAKQ